MIVFVENIAYKEAGARRKRRKQFFGESSTPETELEPQDKFRINPFLDCLAVERLSAYSDFNDFFRFRTKLQLIPNLTGIDPSL